jgi:glycosyltransferase involved in cell wall biosynthesis
VSYALLLYRFGYSIPARCLERADQFNDLKKNILKNLEISQILWLDFSTLFPFFLNPRKSNPKIKIICNAHNIEYRVLERLKTLSKDELEKKWYTCQAEIMKKVEYEGFLNCDLVITCSDIDKKEILLHLPQLSVEVIPNGVDMDYFIPNSVLTIYPSLLFTGTMGYYPNRDAVDYFMESIFPPILKKHPTCTFIIAGAGASSSFSKYSTNDNVEIISSPEDMRPIYNKAWLVVVPLRSGSGTRLKILEAIAMGRKIVSSKIGAEGIKIEDEDLLMIAEDEKDFAEKICTLISNRQFLDVSLKASRDRILKLYDWSEIREKARKIVLNYI